MTVSIKTYSKSSNFLQAQIDRNIDDNIIQLVLSKINQSITKRTLIIVNPNIIHFWIKERKLSNSYSQNKYLFIVLDTNELITCFFADHNHYQGRKDNINYIIISKLNNHGKNS